MFRKILVPLDGSSLSEAVLPYVEQLISETNAEVTLLAVAESPAPIDKTTVEHSGVRDVVAAATAVEPTIEQTTIIREGETQPQAEQRIRDELTAYLAERGRGLAATGTMTTHTVLFGDPADRIVDYANQGRFDVIAMATHGYSGLRHLLAGSVTSRVLEQTGRPVLLVRPADITA